jgi:repressor LexA
MSSARKRTSLTRRQREIYEYLREKIVSRGYGPTVREIGTEFNIRSPNGVMCHLKALERKGLISRESNMSRAIQLADSPHRELNLPLLATVEEEGDLHETNPSENQVSFGELFNGDDRVCIEVHGNRFDQFGIRDGDYIIVSRNQSPEAGGLVAVEDDHHALRLQKFASPSVGANGSHHGDPAGNGAAANLNSDHLNGTEQASSLKPNNRMIGVVIGVTRLFAPTAPTADPSTTFGNGTIA